jgi:hypothetical protein
MELSSLEHISNVMLMQAYTFSYLSNTKVQKQYQNLNLFEFLGNIFLKKYRKNIQNIGEYRKNRRFFKI